ncbi:MAG TPA: cysteine--tRNA ligase [Polyangiaceae bacterium]
MASLPSLYNTLTRRVEPLEPLRPGEVTVYCCGVTAYDVPHIGHARAALLPDLLVRRLRALGQRVTYARNVTDVDDKILARAQKNGEEPLGLSRRMAVVYQEQMRSIGCLDPDQEPRVSEHLNEIVALVERLVERDAAYVVDMPGGKRDVYFSVRSFPGYGKLSRRRIDELVAGARVELGEEKRDPLDFALWKGAAADEWAWDSPWGRGRPGWHIECSAMSTRYLGQPFDVHTGGMDLIFPHHENEIAQSESAHPESGALAKTWLHNGFLDIDKEKMSKSLGNSITLGDLLERNDPEGFRYFLLGVHYRGPIHFDTEKLADGRVVFPGVDEAERRVDYLFSAVERLRALSSGGQTVPAKPPQELVVIRKAIEKAVADAETGLDDDLNSPVALAALGEIARHGHELADLAQKKRKDATFLAASGALAEQVLVAVERVAGQLGLLQTRPDDYRTRTRERRLAIRGLTAESIRAKVDERTAARAAKDFARGDALRGELAALGVSLHDGPEGTGWTIEQ